MRHPISAREAARRRFMAARNAQVDTGFADLTTDVTVLDGAASVPSAPDASPVQTTVSETVSVDVETPVITETPVAEVNVVELPVATPSAPDMTPLEGTEPQFPATTAPDGEAMGTVEPQSSVTAQRAAFIAGMRLVEARISAGIEDVQVDKVARADSFAKGMTLGEMRVANDTISEMLSKTSSVTAVRGTLVPRRAERVATAGVPAQVVPESLFL